MSDSYDWEKMDKAMMAELEAKGLDGYLEGDDQTDFLDDSAGVWMTYDVYDDGQGGVDIEAATNDNLDTGYPSQHADWHLHFKRAEDGLKHVGYSRTGVSGVKVTVMYNGVERVRPS